MLSLDSEHACLLELIKAALFDCSPNFPSEVNWDLVFEYAKAQCVVPLVVSSVPSEHRGSWMNISYLSKAHYMKMLYEQNSLVELFKSNNIPSIIFKGVAAAIYYPNPAQRTFGDIDFYVSEEYFALARNLLEQNGYIYSSNNERHYVYNRNGMIFELHNKIGSDNYNDIEKRVLEGFNNSVDYKIGNSSFPGLPTYVNGLVLLGHIKQHLKDTGIGLRQIIDWMMFVCKELDDSAWNTHFRQLACEAGLEDLAITVTYLCIKWLGLPNRITWCNSADETVAERLFIRVLDDGNFGRDIAPYENVKKKIKKEGAFSYLQRSGIETWSLAQKYKVFRPFAWLYQICKYACKGIAGIFTGKKVFRKDKQV